MKILALNASHRGRRGLTHILLERMAEGTHEGGTEFETIVLAEREVRRCLGCEVCHTGEGPRHCVFEGRDDVKAIFRSMREADVLVFATPVYVFAMSSLLKALIERFNSECDTGDIRVSRSGLVFHHIDEGLCSKPFVLVVPYGNIEAETPQSVIEYFKTYSRFMDAPMLAALPRSGAFLLERSSLASGDPASLACAQILSAFREAGLDLARRGKIAATITRHATRSLVSMPAPVRALMTIRPLRGRLIMAAKARGILRFR